MSIDIHPMYAYRSEHKQTWIDNSIALGQLAADQEIEAQQEIRLAICDYGNVHRLRHAHLALLVWYAEDSSSPLLSIPGSNVEQNIDAWDYCRLVLGKPDKKSGFNQRVSDPWVAASMTFGFGRLVQSGRISASDLVTLITDEKGFAGRFTEQGILPALLEAFNEIIIPLVNEQNELVRLCDRLYRYLLDIPVSIEFAGDLIASASSFINQLIKNATLSIDPDAPKEEKKRQAEENRKLKQKRLADILQDVRNRLESEEEESRKNFYAFLLADLVEKQNLEDPDIDILDLLEKMKLQCHVPEWNIGLEKDNRIYRKWITESIERLQDEGVDARWILSVVIPKAIRELSGKAKEIVPLLQKGIRELGLGSNAVFPFLRGLKVNYQEQRIVMEREIAGLLEQNAKLKKIDLQSGNIKKMNDTLYRFKRTIGFQVYYAVKLTRTFQSINSRFFKEIPTIIIECLQSAWLVFSEVERLFKKHKEALCGSGTEMEKVVNDGFYREFYKLVFRILSSHMQTRIFKTMKDFCMVPEIGIIIELYESLSEYYNLNEESFHSVITALDDQYDYLPDSLRIYPFLQIDIDQTYKPEEALSRIIIEKSFVDFMVNEDIEEQLVDDIFITEYSKIKIETDNRVLLARDIIDDWINIREDLFRYIEMDYGKRIELLQKSSVLLGRLNELLRELLPTPAYFVHAWVIRLEQERCDREIEMVKNFQGKREKKIAVLIDESKKTIVALSKNEKSNSFQLDLNHMTLTLCYQYATRTMQKPLAIKLKGFMEYSGDYIRRYAVSFKNRFHFKFNTVVISGILLTVGVGYIAPFITGGNTDFWSFFKQTNWLSIFICMIFMMVMCRKKIEEIVRGKVGVIDSADIYAGYTVKKRVRFLFRQGQFFAYLISLLGLLIWHPDIYRLASVENLYKLIESRDLFDLIMQAVTKFSWKMILSEVVEPIAKYLVAFPYVALFIGLFLENKLED